MTTRRQFLALAGLSACARPLGQQAQALTASEPTAHIVAASINGGKTGSLYHNEGARHLNAPDMILTVDGMPTLFDRTGLDPRRDIDRAFSVAPEAFSDDGVTVLEHALPAERIADIFGSRRVEGLGFPAAEAVLSGIHRVVAAPAPNLLVMAQAHRAAELHRFATSGGLPAPQQGEMAYWFSEKPHALVDPAFFPETLLRAEIFTALDAAGTAKARFIARSNTPDQARIDATELTRRAADATTVDIGPFRFALFGDITFSADGDQIICDKTLSADEVSWVVAVMVNGIPI